MPSPRWSRTVGCEPWRSARSTVSRSPRRRRSSPHSNGWVSSTATEVWSSGPRNLGAVPEGDTIHRTATALRAALLGKVMTGFEAPRLDGHRPAIGAVIERVDSRGKHIEIGWDDGTILHTHMRMTGSWHLYRPGERWRKSTPQHAGGHRGRGLRGRVLQRPGGGDLPGQGLRPPPGPAGGARAGPVRPGRRRGRVRAAHPPVLRRVDHGGRAAAGPARRLGRGQRLQERGPVGLRRAPADPGRRARRRHPAGAVGDGRRVPPGQPRPADPHDAPRQRRGRGGLRALRQAVLPVRHARSRSAATASSPG